MYDSVVDFAIATMEAITIVALIGAVSLAGVVALQQLGKRNRNVIDKLSHKKHKIKRGIFKRVADVAIDNHDDFVADQAIDSLARSYITTFGKDVTRGVEVLFQSCTREKSFKFK